MNLSSDVPSVTVVGWNRLTNAVMVAFVIVASTLVPGNTLHCVFIKKWLGVRTLWITAYMTQEYLVN